MDNPYHLDPAPGIYSGYSALIGPDGFTCTLTEPEDRTWGRDLAPVVDRLNLREAQMAALHVELARYKGYMAGVKATARNLIESAIGLDAL